MTDASSIDLRFEPPGPGTLGAGPRALPAPGHAVLGRDPSGAVLARRLGVHGVLRHAARPDRQCTTSTALRTARWFRSPTSRFPSGAQRAEEVWAEKLWRDQLREWDDVAKPAAIATHRELQAVDPDALSDAELVAYLTRCRDHHARDDRPAHALHGRRDDLRRRPARPRRRMERRPAVGSARDDARHGSRVRRSLRRARTDSSPRSTRTRRRANSSSPTTIPARCSQRCARSAATSGLRCRATSTSWGTGSSTASTSPAATPSSCPTCSCARCAPRWRVRVERPPTPTPASPRCASRSPSSIEPSSTGWSPRRG